MIVLMVKWANKKQIYFKADLYIIAKYIKLGYGHEEELNMQGYVVLFPKKYSDFAVSLCE